MLTRLQIKNYALISSLEVRFPEGLSIITGETGAGKSIMLGALSLLTGARADAAKTRREGEKTLVEAEFSLADPAPALLEILESECGEEVTPERPLSLILRREISASGRSRAFVNDSPVTLAALSRAAAQLIDIHSQHSNSLIADEAFQLRLIDAMASDAELLSRYKSLFSRYVELRNELRRRREALARSREQEEFLRFRLENLRRLNLRAGEQAELERRQELLSSAQEISAALSQACSLLDESELSALSSLSKARSSLGHVNFSLLGEQSDPSRPDASLLHRLESAEIEIRDIFYTLQQYLENIDSDPALLRATEERLEDLYEAERRFKVSDDAALISLQAEIEADLENLEGSDESLHQMEADLSALARDLQDAAARLSKVREEAAADFSRRILEISRPLGFHNLKFSLILEPGKLSIEGADRPRLLCAFNKNQELMPVGKVASGGEISRLMLCIKSLVAGRMQLPTIIFDEVDTGVSGDIANRMGALMLSLSRDIQVIAITHLPQVAASGVAHFKVYKRDTDEATVTDMVRLSPEERRREIACMLSGAEVDEAAMLNARSLLEQAQNQTLHK